ALPRVYSLSLHDALPISSPPRWVSPLVESTSNTPSPSSRMEISKVPPPRSYTAIFWSVDFLSRPYAKAAAVGSLMIRLTLSPARSEEHTSELQSRENLVC